MNREDKHLDLEQVELLISAQEGDVDPGALDEARRHVAACESCQRLVAMEQTADRVLRALRDDMPAQSSTVCPSRGTLYELAAGLLKAPICEELMKHVVECGHCAPLLRQSVEALTGERTAEEDAALRSLQTGRAEWQAAFAQRLAASVATGQERDGRRVRAREWLRNLIPSARWAYALVAAVSLSALATGIILWRSRAPYAERLLATAYSERRTLELRIPGARHAPLRITRGSQTSNVDRPAPLLKAEEMIGRELIKQPRSTVWLQAKLRADLLDGNYDSAIHSGEIALEQEPESASMLSDLGMAYFERAESENSAGDYAKAYQLLSESLAKTPDDPVTLFNRAITAERAQLYSQALADWKQYLSVDSDQEWRTEAQAKMKEVEEKLREQKNRSHESLTDAGELVAALTSGQSVRISNVDSQADSLEVVAVAKWIPELASGRIIDSRHRDSLREALRQLAALLRVYHNDSWLTDFLSEESVWSQSRGPELLSKAVHSAADGNQDSAIRFASAAEKEFQKEHNEAGRARAAFQHVYSNRLAAHGSECYEQAERLLDEITGRSYVWLEIQSRLEAAACAAEVSRIDESTAGSQKALELAKQAKYGNLELRATMFVADLVPDSGMRLDILRKGMVAFWSGTYEPMRGYSLYAAMDTTAADLQLWFVDEAAIQEGLRLIEDDPDKSLRGLERYRLARAQLGDGKPDDAERTAEEASGLLSESSSPALYADALIDLADSFVMKGRYRDALNLLSSAEPHLQNLSQDIVLEKFYATRADALLGNREEAMAEEALAPALKLAEKARVSIATEADWLSWSQTLEPVYRSFAYLELQKDAQRSFRAWESFKGGPIGAFTNVEEASGSVSAWEPTLPAFPSWSSKGTLLLSYGAFPDGIAVWAYDGNQVQSLWVRGSAAEIESLARRFQENCSNPRSDPETVSVEGRELYELLVKPAEGWIRGRSRLIVETDLSLESIPFEALVDGTGKYLSDSYEIAYSAGLFFLVDKERPGTISRASNALVIGESLGDSRKGLRALPDAREEAREVAARFAEPVLLLDGSANLPRVEKELPRAEVFHFAGHAIGSGRFTGLLLGPSQLDDASRLFEARNFSRPLFRESRVVVFSACSTANGSGEGLANRDSLARSALAAGVPHVLASRWIVDSSATREWMRSFYRRAVEGDSVSSAAKQARIALRASKEWRHPFYWASFSVFV